jgi:O-Antigen ligase
MAGLAICILAALICFCAGRVSLWGGFVAAMTFGYLYGILRANIPSAASHFIFDAASFGLYASIMTRPASWMQKFKMRQPMPWFVALMGWPILLFFVPVQNPLIQLVGLRAQIFFIPYLLIGSIIDGEDAYKLAMSFAVMNIVELGIALVEIAIGVPFFFPRNAVDQIIYNSTDVYIGGIGNYRIPATFMSSAAYGGDMVGSLPLLLGALSLKGMSAWGRRLVLVAVGASAVGVFLCASRSQAVLLIVMITAVTLSGQIKNIPWSVWFVIIGIIAWIVVISPRMQRFFQLQDTDYVKRRVSWSVNESFWQIALDYPLGNGLGGGGTSVPYFLQDELKDPVGMENEYARIMAEEGIPGLMLWLGFLGWVFTRPLPRRSDPWFAGRMLARFALLVSFATGMLGTGLLTAIPGTATLMLYIGWISAPQEAPQWYARRRIVSREVAADALQGA